MRRLALHTLWLIGSLFGRKRRATEADYARHEYRAQTRMMGVTMTERIRDAFRRSWLRVRSD